MADNEEGYPRWNGVLMKPGVRVYCDDRDEPVYDEEGTITAVHGNGIFDVSFGDAILQMYSFSISLCSEELDSEDARKWRAEHSLRVFLCHASEDKPTIRALYTRLQELGFRPWLDEVDLAPGVEWEPAIETAVRNSHVILVCLSLASTTKVGFVQKEIHFALERALEMPEGAIYVVPVRLDKCTLPKRLNKWQAVDLYAERGEDRLLQALRSRAEDLALLPRRLTGRQA